MDQTNPVPSMQHIFVSYSRADREMVDGIVARLKSDGFDVWIDREEIQVGAQWGAEIVEAVGKAYAFLLMLSPSAVDSRYVHDEVYLAYKGRGPKELVYVPVMLSPVQIEDDLSLPLARVQYIEYYRDPEAKYTQIVKALQSRTPKHNSPILAMGLALLGLKPSNFDGRKQKHLLDAIANFTGTPRAAVEIAKPIDKNGYIVVKMPADAAYRLKTAALNRDTRLLKFDIKALRLTGDHSFVWVKSGRFGPFKPRKTGIGIGRRVMGFSAVLIALLLALFTIMIGLSWWNGWPFSFFSTPTFTATNTDTPTPSSTFTATETITITPSLTHTPTDTITPSPTNTFTPTFTPSVTPTWTFSPTPTRTRTPTNTPNPPAIFSDLNFDTTLFYCLPPPQPSNKTSVRIRVTVQDPSGVSKVRIDYWFEDKVNEEKWYSDGEDMVFKPGPNQWQSVISIPYQELQGDDQDYYWLQFAFTVIDNVGAPTFSPEYRDRVTLSCVELI